MKDFQSLINYTLDKKKLQLKDEVYFKNNPLLEIQSFINDEEDDTTVSLSLDFLSSWYHFEFITLSVNNNKPELSNLQLATFYGIEANKWDFFLGRKFEAYAEAIQFHKAIKHMAQALVLGWDKLAIDYGKLLLKMLYGKQYKGWHSAYKHPWFMLEVFCKWQKIDLNYDKLNYPQDMNLYKRVLEHWNTNDVELIQELVNNLVDYHIAQSDEDEYKDKTPDFPSSDYFIYPIEIIFWLNIRERLELPVYNPDNELMKMPLNTWHNLQTEIPKIDLIDDSKTKLMKDYPDITFDI